VSLEHAKEARKKLSSINGFHRSLRIVPVRRSEHFFFNLLEFRFFRDSEQGAAMPFGDHQFLYSLATVPYILVAELIFFRAKRYFIRLGKTVAGVVAFHEEPDSLFIGSLGVAKEYRRFGIATYILRRAERLAVRLDKGWLELSVLKGNAPAQRLYVKLGFFAVKERRWSFIMREQVGLH
jgi:ribosomal protein S18 acetylase RimI-like enzyme